MQVVEVGDEGVVAVVGRARMLVAYGEMVRANGRLCRLASEPPPDEAMERALDSLRKWRSGRAAAEGKPAYVFLHDRTIEALATIVPTTMRTLAIVKGIGPAKLEAYGEELLALLIAARDGA
jgi:DNA helicase-2/ATP-dependent DNA helicase PcrA